MYPKWRTAATRAFVTASLVDYNSLYKGFRLSMGMVIWLIESKPAVVTTTCISKIERNSLYLIM